ncbi:MAG: hypothetical protein PVH88_17935 [Ignavibacteria bacterium]
MIKKFLKRSNALTALIVLILFIPGFQNLYSQSIIFPRAFGIAIDDMGWNQGSSLGDEGGPWRAGVNMEMTLKHYSSVVEIAKGAGIRLQGLFILSEMDRLNICAKYPTTTKAGADFDNSENIEPEQIEIMNYVKENAAYLEFGLHGVGHEHFDNGIRTRAEWYDIENNKPWPESDTRDHIKAFKEIMAQYGITEENGQSFPESFVPCAYSYYWNPDGELSTGKLLSECGVKYANTLFQEVSELNPPIEEGGGLDHGVLVQNRINYGNEWFKLSALPKESYDKYESDVIETHWPNLLAQDYSLQDELNKKWVEFFKNIQRSDTKYLSKNTEQNNSQWLYKKYAQVEIEDGKVFIDNSQMPDDAYKYDLLGNFVLKIKLNDGQHISKALLNAQPISAYFEDEGFGFIYLPKLEKENYELDYEVGSNYIDKVVYNKGTYNVYSVKDKDGKFVFDIKMYGTQNVNIKCPKPVKVSSSNPNLEILSQEYSEADNELILLVKGRDMQGEKGTITVNF